MKQLSALLLTGLAVLGLASQAVAQVGVGLSMQPSPQTINVGDPTSMDLVVSGLGDLSSPSLGAFDFNLSYDPAIVSAVSVVFGNYLDLGILGSVQFSDLNTAGLIHLDEVSFETPSDLNDAQPGTFTLATLNFTGRAPGTSAIEFTFASLSDEQGQSLVGFSTSNGSIEVKAVTAVPDITSTASLLLLGMVSLSILRRRPRTAIR